MQVIKGTPIKGRWGQWYRHDRVLTGQGQEIGRIQVRRRYYGKRCGHRIDCLTLDNSGHGVIGSNIEWLVRQANAAAVPV